VADDPRDPRDLSDLSDLSDLPDLRERADRRVSRWDPLSFGVGTVLLLLALTVLAGGGHGIVDNAGWVLPLALIAIGLLGVTTGGSRSRRW
jgi:hypothetical protein